MLNSTERRHHGDAGSAVSPRENAAIRADILAMQETLAALDRFERLKEELAAAGQMDLAMLSVATNELRSLV